MFDRAGLIAVLTALALLAGCPKDCLDDDDTAVIDDPGDDDSADLPDNYAPVSAVTVTVHPEVATILEVTWTQDEDADAAYLEFTFEDGRWSQSPAEARAAGEHREVILGVPAETDVSVQIVNEIGGEQRVSEQLYSGTTGPLPEDLLAPELVSYDPELAHPAGYMLGSVDQSINWYAGPFWLFILDRQARVVWYYLLPDRRCSLFPQVSSDGTHLLYEGSTNYVFDQTVLSILGRVTLDFSYHEVVEIPELNFSFDEIDGGRVLYNYAEGHVALVERDADGVEREVWNCSDWIFEHGGSDFHCAANSVIWNPATDTVMWSMYNIDTVVEVQRETGELLRQWGQLDGGWAFEPADTEVDYQHYPNYTPDGTIIVSTHAPGGVGQYAREFLPDDASQTMQEVWHYGEEVKHYARYGGEALRLDNGNSLLCYGTDGSLREVTMDRRTAWDIVWPSVPNTHLTGHNTMIEDLYALNRGPEEAR